MYRIDFDDVSNGLQFVSSRLVSKRLCIEMTELHWHDRFNDMETSSRRRSSLNIELVFLCTLRADRSYSVFLWFEIKQTLIQINRRSTRNGVMQTKRLHWNSAKRIKSKYDTNPPKAKCFNPTNSTVLILWRAKTSKPKHEIYTHHFLFDNNGDLTKPIFLLW